MRPNRPLSSWTLCLAAILVASPPVVAVAKKKSAASSLDDTVRSWSKRHRGKKGSQALASLEDAVAVGVPAFGPGSDDEDRRLAGLRRIGAALEWPASPEETKRFKGRTAKKKGPSGPRTFPLPRQVMYRFGYRELTALDEKNRALKAALKRRRPPTPADLAVDARLEALLRGALPETELVVAELQRRLDVDPTADLYARFLETWRNWGPYGEESFYEALDRTAGTRDEVFFYDAMLADFVGNFAPDVGKRWVLQKQHDTNQQAFLAYRQYRGFIEAVSYALVTAPDVALPGRLARYDYGSVASGLFSLRHQLDLLVEFAEGDVEAVAEELRAFLEEHPMPAELWTGYDPMSPLRELFRQKVDRRVTGTGRSADELFEKQRAERVALAEAVRVAAARGVDD